MKIALISIILFLISSISFGQNFWQQTNGPYGGGIICVACKSNGEVFCGTSYTGGMYRTGNNGGNWSLIYPVFAFGGAIRTLAVDSYDNVYASINGVFKSTDDGSSWIQITSSFFPYSIAVNASGHIFAGTGEGILYRSTNNGANWVPLTNLTYRISNVSIKSNGYIYIASYSGLYRSTNNGDEWTRLDPPGTLPGIDLSIDSTGSLLLCNYTGILKTTNDGLNWSVINNATPATSIAVTAGNIYYAGISHGKIIKSTDGGATWVVVFDLNLGSPANDIQDIVCKRDGTLMVGNSIGMLISTDAGANWNRINNGITNTYVSSVASDGNGKIYATLNPDGVYMSSNSGNLWNQIGLYGKYASNLTLNGANNIFVYVYDSPQGTYRSTDAGLSWSIAINGFPQSNAGLVYKAISGIIFAAGDFGVYKSTDNGSLWIPANLNPDRVRYLEKGMTNDLYACKDTAVYHSTDLGASWIRLSSLGHSMNSFAASSYNGFLYNISLPGFLLYRSSNGGLSWDLANNSFQSQRVTCGPYGILLAYTFDNLIYRSNDNGNTWVEFMAGQPITDAAVFGFDQDGYAYAGAWSAGVYRSILPIVSVKNISSSVPNTFSLYQNYPNPFNPSTKIKFQIAKLGNVKLIIYDALGREVATLVNEQLQPGTYEAEWDGTNYASGIYYYRFQSEGFIDIKKMVLVK